MGNHLACFALAAENLSRSEHVDNLGTHFVSSDFDGGHVAQISTAAEESFGSSLRLACFFLAMHKLGNLVGQHFFSFVDSSVLEGCQTMYLVHRQIGQQCQAVFNIAVVNIAPVLVEIVGRGLFGIQPQGTLFGFAHFFAFAVGQKLAGHAVSGLLLLAANQLYAAQHIGPLVVAAQLHNAAIILMQLPEIVGLHNHIVELEEG